VLLRRGLPPAVPREEPVGLLRPRWHGRQLPGGPGGSVVGRCSRAAGTHSYKLTRPAGAATGLRTGAADRRAGAAARRGGGATDGRAGPRTGGQGPRTGGQGPRTGGQGPRTGGQGPGPAGAPTRPARALPLRLFGRSFHRGAAHIGTTAHTSRGTPNW